jgi:hypothetical protein
VDATSANTASKVVARDASGNFSAGTVTAALSGNATTASTLQTARTIGGVSFNGSANINLPGVNTAGNQNTSGTAAVSTAATVTTSATSSAFKVPFANTTASTTGNYGLLQDSTATFTYNPSTNTLVVGTVSAALSGNATTATTLQTARTINGVSFNGSANITVADATKMPLTGGTFTGNVSFGNFAITDVENITVDNQIISTGDTNTYIQFHAADQWRVVTGGSERLEVNNTNTTIANNLIVSGSTTLNGNTTLGNAGTDTITVNGAITFNGTVTGIAAGAQDGIFWENDQTVTANYTITSGKNAGTFGPISIASGVTVTVPSGSTWTVV